MSEPFGYFKAEPFGWTDCAETDEGAVALYEHPAVPQGWKLVPYDPSIDMQEHGSIASGYDLSQARAKKVYQAMIDMHDVMMEREPTDEWLRLQAGYPEQPAQEIVCSTGLCRFKETQQPAPEQQEIVAWPCVIAEADFEQNTITLEMQCSDYKAGAGQHWLSTSRPASRTWVGLTHDEYDAICDKHSAMSDFDFLADIEAKLREKNK